MTENMTNGLSMLGDLHDYLCSKAHERHANLQHTIVGAFPDIRTYRERVIWGTFSWTLQKAHVRLVRRGTMVSIGGYTCTPGDLVRDYLDYYHPGRLHCTGGQAEIFAQRKPAPLYLKPGVIQDATYVDIHHTYWSILSLVGWNPDYYPGKWFVPGRIPGDFPLSDNKAAYACLVSMALPSKAYIWTGSEFKRSAFRNPHLNLGLWALVQDILHSIAAKAVELGAIYVHTDGYILPSRNAPTLDEYINTWGLPTSVKGSGATVVLGFGNFICGDKRTKHVRPILSQPYNGIRSDTPRTWLHDVIYRHWWKHR